MSSSEKGNTGAAIQWAYGGWGDVPAPTAQGQRLALSVLQQETLAAPGTTDLKEFASVMLGRPDDVLMDWMTGANRGDFSVDEVYAYAILSPAPFGEAAAPPATEAAPSSPREALRNLDRIMRLDPHGLDDITDALGGLRVTMGLLPAGLLATSLDCLVASFSAILGLAIQERDRRNSPPTLAELQACLGRMDAILAEVQPEGGEA